MAEVKTEAVDVKQWDLVPKMAPYLDRHLILPLLEFLEDREIYPTNEIKRAKMDLLAGTNMVDFVIDIYQSLNQEAPAELQEKRHAVMKMHEELQAKALPMIELAQKPDLVKSLKEAGNLNKIPYLTEHHNITENNVKAFYQWAKFSFECGDYTRASDNLALFREVCTEPELATNALWGKLAANILMEKWDVAIKDFQAVREIVESRAFTNPTVQLQQRTWLLHWSLSIFFNHPESRSILFEWYQHDRTFSAIQTSCPHLLRYLIVASIISKRRIIKDMVKLVDQESYNYSDPITQFIEALYNHLDFEGAEQKLALCSQVLQNDPYLQAVANEFLENSRLLIFEMFCKLHNCIDTKLLATKLNMSPEESEKWIVNLIRGAKLDAKIDTQANQVLIGSQPPSLYQQLIDRTRLLTRPLVPVPGTRKHRNEPIKASSSE